jgi:hypothetical protein
MYCKTLELSKLDYFEEGFYLLGYNGNMGIVPQKIGLFINTTVREHHMLKF